MFGDRQPKGFAPGAQLDRLADRILRELGFVPCVPLFSRPNSSDAVSLQGVMHALTFPELGEVGGSLEARPIMGLHALVPDGSGYGEIRNTPMKVSEVRRVWGSVGSPHWYLEGRLEYDRDTRWFIDRKSVVDCHMHVVLKDYEAYLQLVPIGVHGKLLPDPTSDDLCWGDLSSRTLPPKPAD